MQLKCSRYVFSYNSSPEVVKDYIIRAANLAETTYGRDQNFSRLNQVFEQARFLGWPVPRNYGSAIPEEFSDIPPPGIDHIFENQAKLLVDIAPVARVMLTNGQYCSVKMVCSSTAAGDLLWKCHLLTKDGCPYVVRKGKSYKVATKGTKIVCQTETLPYDEKEVFEAFGGDKDGVWPVPFLPEFCIDRPVAGIFAPETGVVESMKIHEKNPVIVLATEMVPWYRVLSADSTKALTVDDREYEEEQYRDQKKDKKLGKLVAGWEELDDESPYEEMEHPELPKTSPEEPPQYINLQTELSPAETKCLQNYDTQLSELGISSRDEAEQLKSDPKHKARAEKWMLAAVQRARLLANASQKIGCLVSLVQRHRDQQILVVQPHQKWAEKLANVLSSKGFKAKYCSGEKTQLRDYYEGLMPVMVTSSIKNDMLLEDIVIIVVTSFGASDWLEQIMPNTLVYAISVKQLGYEDNNLITEHPSFDILDEYYTGPAIDLLRLETPQVVEKLAKPAPEITEGAVILPPGEINPETTSDAVESGAKPKRGRKKTKFRVKPDTGEPKMAPSYEKALEIAKKLEGEGRKVEIYPPDSEEASYISGLGELDK
jgi:hypothetical protein